MYDLCEIVVVFYDVWQFEDWVWWIVGVDCYFYVGFFGDWNDCFQEVFEVGLQCVFVDVVVVGEQCL